VHIAREQRPFALPTKSSFFRGVCSWMQQRERGRQREGGPGHEPARERRRGGGAPHGQRRGGRRGAWWRRVAPPQEAAALQGAVPAAGGELPPQPYPHTGQ
jgi:hypothetical protein